MLKLQVTKIKIIVSIKIYPQSVPQFFLWSFKLKNITVKSPNFIKVIKNIIWALLKIVFQILWFIMKFWFKITDHSTYVIAFLLDLLQFKQNYETSGSSILQFVYLLYFEQSLSYWIYDDMCFFLLYLCIIWTSKNIPIYTCRP